MIYIHYYRTAEEYSEIKKEVFSLASKSREVNIVAPEYPLLNGVTVLNNITLQAKYLYGSNPSKTKRDIINLLNNFSMLYIINKYPDTLNTYEKFVASYLQATYVHPNTTVVVNPTQMLNWQRVPLENVFKLMPKMLNTIIIENSSNKRMYSNITINKEVDFYQWLDSLKNLLSIV